VAEGRVATAGSVALRGGLVQAVGYAVGLGFTAVAIAALFPHLGVALSGRYVVVLTVVALFGAVTDAGFGVVAIREVAIRSDREADELLGRVLGLRTGLASLAAAIGVLMLLISGYPPQAVAGAVFVGVGMVVQTAQATVAALLLRAHRFTAVTVADVVRQGVNAVVILLFVHAGAAFWTFFTAVPISALASLLVTVAYAGVGRHLIPLFRRSGWSPLLVGMLPLAVASAIAVVQLRIAVPLVELLASSAQTGYFGFAARVTDALITIPTLIVVAALPTLSRAAADRVGLRRATQDVFDGCVAVGALLAFTLALAAPRLVSLLANDSFRPSVPVLRLEAGVVLAAFAAAPIGAALIALRRHRELLVMNGLALLVVLALLIALVPTWGARGAAGAVAASQVVLVSAGVVLLWRSGVPLSPGVLPYLVAVVTAASLIAWSLPGIGGAAVAVLFLTVAVGAPTLRRLFHAARA
jgi:O-antigen/teichoic acid export membrane protein